MPGALSIRTQVFARLKLFLPKRIARQAWPTGSEAEQTNKGEGKMAENKVLTMNGQEKPETLAIFLDFANIDFAFRQLEKEWSPEWLKEYLTEGRKLAEAFCYLGLNPHNLAGSQRFASHLRACGYFVAD